LGHGTSEDPPEANLNSRRTLNKGAGNRPEGPDG
jgi:hypothetical protein